MFNNEQQLILKISPRNCSKDSGYINHGQHRPRTEYIHRRCEEITLVYALKQLPGDLQECAVTQHRDIELVDSAMIYYEL